MRHLESVSLCTARENPELSDTALLFVYNPLEDFGWFTRRILFHKNCHGTTSPNRQRGELDDPQRNTHQGHYEFSGLRNLRSAFIHFRAATNRSREQHLNGCW